MKKLCSFYAKPLSFIVLLFLLSSQSQACDMMAMIAKGNNYLNDLPNTSAPYPATPVYTEPYGYLNFLMSRSSASSNMDGYGVLYYKKDGLFFYDDDNYVYNSENSGFNSANPGNPNNQAWYLAGEDKYYQGSNPDWKWALDQATTALTTQDVYSAKIALGHVRLATPGQNESFILGNHPFRFEYNGKTYSLMHNGGLGVTKALLYNKLIAEDPNWWTKHPSNWTTSPSVANCIDSEIFFHWVMYNVDACDGSLLQGLRQSFTTVLSSGRTLDSYLANINLNFIISDGETVYAFRGKPINSDFYNLSYKDNGNFWGIKTQATTGTQLQLKQLLCISPYFEKAAVIPNFSNPINTNALCPSNITTNYTFSSYSGLPKTRVIDYNITINSGATVTIPYDVTLQFTGECKIIIKNGSLVIKNGASVELAHQSYIEVNGFTSSLIVEGGGKLSGYAQNTKDDEHRFGDRVISRDGGKLLIGQDGSTNQAQIYSRSSNKWAGFEIQAGGVNPEYKFQNANISGIDNIYIKSITGIDHNLLLKNCTIINSNGIMADNISKLDMQNCTLNNINGTGVALYVSGAEIIGNTIQNCYNDGISVSYLTDKVLNITDNNIIQNNRGNGISLYSCKINDIANNTIINNISNGIYTWDITKFGNLSQKIKLNNISDNGSIEYVGKYNDFKLLTGCGNYISDIASNGGEDLYILSILGLDGSVTKPVDVSGNTFPQQSSTTRFAPSYDLYYFGIGIKLPNPAKEAYSSALAQIDNGNYTTARIELENVVAMYPESPEAGASLNSLLDLELIDRQNYAELRTYLNSLPTDSPIELTTAVKDAEIGSYICEKEYNSALPLLETKINSTVSDAAKVNALLDQAYCEYSLFNDNKAVPNFDKYSVKLKSAADFSGVVSELKARLNANNENNQSTAVTAQKATIEHHSYPNPFNPETNIEFKLSQSSQVNLTIYNVSGQKVAVLFNGLLSQGQHSFILDSRKFNLATGIYYYRLEGDFGSVTSRVMLLK